MCEFCDKIKKIIDSDFSKEIKEKKILEETEKELIMDFIEDNDLGIPFSELGITEEQLDDPGNLHPLTENDRNMIQESFAATKVISLYRYTSDFYGASDIGDNSREFCKRLVKRTRASLMRFEDIEALNSSNPGFGKGGTDTYNVLRFAGGVACKHYWVKYLYQPDTKNLVKATKQPDQPRVNGMVPGAPKK